MLLLDTFAAHKARVLVQHEITTSHPASLLDARIYSPEIGFKDYSLNIPAHGQIMDAQFSVASIPPFPLQDFQDHTGAYDQMTCNSSNSELPWIYNHSEPLSNNTNFDAPASFNSLFFNSEALRFPGDGLDFRRPAMPGPEQDVVDLTENSSPVEPRVHLDLGLSSVSTPSRANRPPRFSRDIIDLEEQEDTANTVGVRAGSPEIEFVSSRALPPTTQSRSQSAGRHHGRRNAESDQHIRPPESNRNRPTGGWLDLRDQVSRVHQSVRRHPRINPLNALIHRDVPNRTPPRNQILDVDLDTIFVNTTQNMILPGELDFSTQGFLMGDVVRPPPPPPTYDAPPTPRKGFTRSPKEEDVLVCPNCEEELGIGGNDFKRQVWVIKSCGHVYCGECTRYRFKNKAKPKSKTKHFSKCVVDGCGDKTVTNVKSLFQIYL